MLTGTFSFLQGRSQEHIALNCCIVCACDVCVRRCLSKTWVSYCFCVKENTRSSTVRPGRITTRPFTLLEKFSSLNPSSVPMPPPQQYPCAVPRNPIVSTIGFRALYDPAVNPLKRPVRVERCMPTMNRVRRKQVLKPRAELCPQTK